MAGRRCGWIEGLDASSPVIRLGVLFFVRVGFCRWFRINIEGGTRWKGLVLFASFPYPAAGSDRVLACCGATLWVTGVKYLADAGVGVMAWARPARSLY